MKIIFDPQIFTLQKFGGISKYHTQLAKSIFELGVASVKIHCPIYSSQHLKDVPTDVFSGGLDNSNQHFWRFRRLLPSISNLTSFKAFISGERFDILHHTYYWPLPNDLPVRARVTTIHDMIDEELNGITIRSRLKLRSIKQADHVICVSEFTRKSLLKFYNIDPKKISVVYLGKPELDLINSPWRQEGRPWILYVGPRSGYKNFDRFIGAYASSQRLKRDFRLMCFGGGAFTSYEKSRFIKYGISQNDIIFLCGNDSMLYSVYRGSALFVYPSLYEGFGLPPLEAMTQGTPVACANSASIPEIVGNAGEFFNPTDINSIRVSMESVLYSEKRKKELVRAGFEQIKNFSWNLCANKSLEIYNSII